MDSFQRRSRSDRGAETPPTLDWLTNVVRLTIVPALLGALVLLVEPNRSVRDLAAAAGLVLLGVIHVLYWRRPWPARPRQSVAAAAGMVATNVVLLNLLDLSQPLLWLYPALIVGAGFRASVAAVGVGLMALAAIGPLDLTASLLAHALDPSHPIRLTRALGSSHLIFLSILLAGLGMTAVRQLIAVNADLHLTRAELAELAVAGERERLAREMHDLLGRTLSLIGVKAELAGRLSAAGDPSAAAEMSEVQQLARHAVREVREAVAGDRTRSIAAEVTAARLALRMAGIESSVTNSTAGVDPAYETTVAWALREAVTNVVKHSGARTCRIEIETVDGITALDVVDDGRGPVGGGAGTGLAGVADRVQALDGTFGAGPSEAGGFRLRVRLGAAPPAAPLAEVAR